MELTLEQIKNVTFGALNVFQDEQGIHFRRFTERQVDVLLDPKNGRDYDTTGIRLDFHTDASRIHLYVASEGKYEILVNDLTSYWERLNEPTHVFLPLESGDKRVTVVLPSHTEGILEKIVLDDATYAQPHKYAMKFAFYGDSITQGWNSEKDAQSYVWLTTRYFDADSMNFGVGGTTFIPELPEDIGFDPDVVIVALGTNDYGKEKTMEQIKSDCKAYLEKIKALYPNSKQICITPIWRKRGVETRAAGVLADVRQVIAEIAQAQGYTVINGLTLIPHRLEYYADNGLHPNDLGFAIYALNLIKFLESHL